MLITYVNSPTENLIALVLIKSPYWYGRKIGYSPALLFIKKTGTILLPPVEKTTASPILSNTRVVSVYFNESLFYKVKTRTASSQALFLKRKYSFLSEYANMMTAAESADLFNARPIVNTEPIPGSLIVLELVRKHDIPDLMESANFFISTTSVGYSSLFSCFIVGEIGSRIC